jgi:pyruvate/2-oxoglutarate dehydrogenase complex dihydrolipoamide dehydrogenase (E3) component
MNYTVLVPFKSEFEDLRSFLVGQVEKLGVHVKLNQEVDWAVIDQLKPDVVIMATGSAPFRPEIPGFEWMQVKGAQEILVGEPFGENIVIIGGGAVGCETAEFLADKGAKVTVVELLDEVAKDVGTLERILLLQRLAEKGVTLLTKTVVREVTPEGDVVIQKEYRQELLKGTNTLVYAVGYQPVAKLEEVLREKGVPYIKIGDCIEARKVIDAIWEGFMQTYQL